MWKRKWPSVYFLVLYIVHTLLLSWWHQTIKELQFCRTRSCLLSCRVQYSNLSSDTDTNTDLPVRSDVSSFFFDQEVVENEGERISDSSFEHKWPPTATNAVFCLKGQLCTCLARCTALLPPRGQKCSLINILSGCSAERGWQCLFLGRSMVHSIPRRSVLFYIYFMLNKSQWQTKTILIRPTIVALSTEHINLLTAHKYCVIS